MSDKNVHSEKLWLKTPLIYSPHLSSRLGSNVYLKLDCLQPSQSYKYRGISYFIQRALQTHGPSVHLIVASGGNAGLAVATAAKALHLRCTVFLPQGASAPILDFFHQEGAEVNEVGKCYAEALAAAENTVKKETHAVMVPAYDDPVLWEGHASMITEVEEQLPAGTKPDAVFCSVGGGGLAGGVMIGCRSVGWQDVPVVTLETTGSNCFYQSIALNPGPFTKIVSTQPANVEVMRDNTHNVNLARLSKLTSRASSLGASSPSAGVVKMALDRKGGIKCVCAPDEAAMKAGLLFAEDHKMLVELACSTTLIPAYRPTLFDKLVPLHSDGSPRTVVFIVCGGFKISLEEVMEYQEIVKDDLNAGPEWEVMCNGEQWSIPKQ